MWSVVGRLAYSGSDETPPVASIEVDAMFGDSTTRRLFASAGLATHTLTEQTLEWPDAATQMIAVPLRGGFAWTEGGGELRAGVVASPYQVTCWDGEVVRGAATGFGASLAFASSSGLYVGAGADYWAQRSTIDPDCSEEPIPEASGWVALGIRWSGR